MRYFIENSFEVLPKTIFFFCVQVETFYSLKFSYRDAMLIPYWKLYFEETNSFLFKRNFLLESDKFNIKLFKIYPK